LKQKNDILLKQINFVILLTLIPLVLSIGIAPILPFVELIPEADALKSKGRSSTQYGSATRGIVCGGQLCSEVSTSAPDPLYERAQQGMSGGLQKVGPSLTVVNCSTSDKPSDVYCAYVSISGKKIPGIVKSNYNSDMISIFYQDAKQITLNLSANMGTNIITVLVDGEESNDFKVSGNTVTIETPAGTGNIEIIGKDTTNKIFG
jgi:hypothetical protein